MADKIKVVVGEAVGADIVSPDGFRVLVGKGTIITRELVAKLSNWIVEEEPSLPVERKKVLPKENKQDAILKRLEFEQIISEKTRKELVTNVDGFFKQIGKQDQKLDVSSLEETIAKMVDDMPDNPDVPLRMSELKRRATHIFNHSVECGIIASFVASALNYSPEIVNTFSLSMMLHDIGILTLPQEILQMKTPLSQDELKLVRQHPQRGWNILKEVPGIEPITQMIVLGHHVHADGSGYPDGINFGELPFLVHMATIISNYESLISWRPYRRAYNMHDAIKLLLIMRDRYHPAALESFIRVVGVFPISTFVRLNTGEIGVVVRNNPENLFLPEIKLVMNPGGQVYSQEVIVNLLSDTDREIVKVEERV